MNTPNTAQTQGMTQPVFWDIEDQTEKSQPAITIVPTEEPKAKRLYILEGRRRRRNRLANR